MIDKTPTSYCYVCGDDQAEVRQIHLGDYCTKCIPDAYICRQCCENCEWWDIDNHCSPWNEIAKEVKGEQER